MAPTLIAMAIDARTFNGINVWIKPFKFEALARGFLRDAGLVLGAISTPSVRARRSVRVARSARSAAPVFFEVGYIAFRAALAEGFALQQFDAARGGCSMG